jgi:hypothetical protein
MLNNLSKAFGDVSLENSLKNEEVNVVDSVFSSFSSSIRARSAVEPECIYNKSPKISSVSTDFAMDFSRILCKPFFVRNVAWAAAEANFNILDYMSFPTQFLDNALATIPVNASEYMRVSACLLLQVSGTPMHSGTVVVSTSPKLTPYTGRNYINTMLACPHVFLSANNSTTACLEIPFMYNNRLVPTKNLGNLSFTSTGSDYAQVSFIVLNQLVPPTNGTTTVSISVHVVFKSVEFYLPHGVISYRADPQIEMLDPIFKSVRRVGYDFLDKTIGAVRAYTGLHNPNDPEIADKQVVVKRNNPNSVDSVTFYEKMDPYYNSRDVMSDYIFSTDQDEMDLKFLLSKPYYLGTFIVSTGFQTGATLFSRPITPSQENLANGEFITMPLGYIHRFARFWRGSLKIHIQASMSNFHFCKLSVFKSYAPAIGALDGYPDFENVQNMLVENIEFSAGGQVATVTLPYVSQFDQLECLYGWSANALSHGVYYIMLTQPLITNGAVPTNVSFNVYVSGGDDLEFFGYSVGTLAQYNRGVPYPNVAEAQLDSDSKVPNQIPDQSALQTEKTITDTISDSNFRRIVSVRDIVRRMYQWESVRITGADLVPGNNFKVFDVAELIGLRSVKSDDVFMTPIEAMARLFYGFRGGIKFKFKVYGANNVVVRYKPPGSFDEYEASGIWRGTSFAPLATTTGATQITTYNSLAVSALPNQNADAYTMPLIEAPNYINSVSYTRNSTGLGGFSYFASYVEVEGEIPYMNPFSFVGDMSRAYVPLPEKRYLSSDLGEIIISFSAMTENALVSPVASDILIVPFVGLTDESRFGLNVLSLPSAIPRLFISPTFYQITPFNNASNAGTAAPKANINEAAPACYYSSGTN